MKISMTVDQSLTITATLAEEDDTPYVGAVNHSYWSIEGPDANLATMVVAGDKRSVTVTPNGRPGDCKVTFNNQNGAKQFVEITILGNAIKKVTLAPVVT